MTISNTIQQVRNTSELTCNKEPFSAQNANIIKTTNYGNIQRTTTIALIERVIDRTMTG